MSFALQRAFESTVGRRMATLFALCTVIPVSVFAIVIAHNTVQVLEARARRVLHFEARSLGQDALGRLDLLARTLGVLASEVSTARASPEAVSAQVENLFAEPPAAISVLPGEGPGLLVIGEPVRPTLTAEQEQHLRDWGRILTTVPAFPGRPVLVVNAVGSSSGIVAAVIDPSNLFAFERDDALPPDSDACVFERGALLACSPAVPHELVDQLARTANDGDFVFESEAGPYMVRTWTLTLGALYDGPNWMIAFMRPQGVVRAPAATFVWNVAFLGALLILVVTWVSLAQVRRLLRPLDTLTAATARLAQRRFDEPVVLASHDEFELLANAFNDLSAELQQQFADLEAFNIGALSALARTVDAKSPWTAGHSERVTAVAVAIAREMRLPAHEIDELQRGGLIHDIGKLATPPEILDKSGSLTPEEMAVIERHPMQGVRILEPIPAFGPLLPIVAQHHEKWDGTGYPARLAGEAIARTARVLAVADVYDAIRSDRPYRAGMAHARVVEIIVSGAGRHFDPAVVGAFMSVAPRVHEVAGYPAPGAEREAPEPCRTVDLAALGTERD